MTARALKNYQDAPHFEIDEDGRPMLEVIVPDALHAKAAEASAKAQRMLKDAGRDMRSIEEIPAALPLVSTLSTAIETPILPLS